LSAYPDSYRTKSTSYSSKQPFVPTLFARAGPSVIEIRLIPGVAESELLFVLEVLREVYARVGAPPKIPEVWLYPSQVLLEAHVSEVSLRVGSVYAIAYEAIVYEAVEDRPRIHVCGKCLHPTPAPRGLLAHEAVHSILHPGVEFYLVNLKPGVEIWKAQVAAAAVKDLEVNLILARRGLRWALEELKDYWAQRLPRHCRRPEDFMNSLKAATVWISLGEDPPLCPEASRGVDALLSLLYIKERPWNLVSRVAELI